MLATTSLMSRLSIAAGAYAKASKDRRYFLVIDPLGQKQSRYIGYASPQGAKERNQGESAFSCKL